MSKKSGYKVILFGAYPENPDVIRGGVEAAVYGLASELDKNLDLKVRVFAYPKKSLKTDAIKSINGVWVAYFANTYGTEILAFLSLKRIIRKIQEFEPDVVHLHGTHLLDFMLISYLKKKKINYVTTVHGILTVEHWKDYLRHKSLATLLKYWMYSFFEVRSIRLSSKIIVDTQYVKDWITTKKLADDSNVHIIPQGINDKFYHIPNRPQACTLLSIGSITERKGYAYAIKAVKKVVNEYQEMRYNIIGFCQQPNYLTHLQSLIVEFKLEDNVFIYKDLDAGAIDEKLSEATIFILHSQEESQGIAFCEAMAVGKPIVTTRVGGIPYVVHDVVNGSLVAFGDIDKFASAILKLLNDNDAREKMSGINIAEAAKYNWNNISRSVLNIY